jgi:UDP-N-acetylmuramate dehydrogenase
MRYFSKKMHILPNISLYSLNTFGLKVTAKHFVPVRNSGELLTVMQSVAFDPDKTIILGGGSNILFLDEYFDGLVIHMFNKGIQMLQENETHILLRICSGEDWHNLVLTTLDMGLSGLENLSLIPGQAGAAPMQNIGAYGVELKDVFHNLEAFDLKSGKIVNFDASDCRFGYRSSTFKTDNKNRYIILSIDLMLTKEPVLKLDYGSLREELDKMGVSNIMPKDVSKAVCRIRRSKLPDPTILGNAGSFFKNPVVDASTYEMLINRFPGIVSYPEKESSFKLAAGWLIEKAGWKGFRKGDAGVHDRQALVIVNHGRASGRQLFALATEVQQSVFDIFGVRIEPEVNIIGNL